MAAKLHKIEAVYTQESSTTAGDWEELKVEMHFMPGAGGPYWVFKSKQWAIESPDEIAKIITSMQKMADENETIL